MFERIDGGRPRGHDQEPDGLRFHEHLPNVFVQKRVRPETWKGKRL
jgi:hypothetical protein